MFLVTLLILWMPGARVLQVLYDSMRLTADAWRSCKEQRGNKRYCNHFFKVWLSCYWICCSCHRLRRVPIASLLEKKIFFCGTKSFFREYRHTPELAEVITAGTDFTFVPDTAVPLIFFMRCFSHVFFSRKSQVRPSLRYCLVLQFFQQISSPPPPLPEVLSLDLLSKILPPPTVCAWRPSQLLLEIFSFIQGSPHLLQKFPALFREVFSFFSWSSVSYLDRPQLLPSSGVHPSCFRRFSASLGDLHFCLKKSSVSLRDISVVYVSRHLKIIGSLRECFVCLFVFNVHLVQKCFCKLSPVWDSFSSALLLQSLHNM